jgi:cellulose synthase/poly-beta-1,6-N-acetylglucosamine synthase-like glycosyltransferase
LIAAVAVTVLTATSVLLFVFGANLLYLTVRAVRRPCLGFVAAPDVWNGDEPCVCVQVPIYNERYVAERVISAVCALDWPRDRFEVQVLDDSDDETAEIVAERAAHWRRKGVLVDHVRRGSREGFKAGALAYGLTRTKAPFVAIFDADFVPGRDFLRRIMAAFDDPSVAFAQARWGHLDETYSVFTRLQAMVIDFHFLVEQPVRSSSGYFTNFTGTAGVWRREAIEDAGGWTARTLTEDLDLSYRAQLRGWKSAYLEDVVVPEELPVSIDAYRRQQSRWATGSFQTAIRMVGPVLRSGHSPEVKFQAVIHLVAYGVGPVMLLQLACFPLLLFARTPGVLRLPWLLAAPASIALVVGIAPWVGFIAARTRRGLRWWSGVPSLLCQVIGAGMSVNTLIALVRALRPGGAFERTPKHRIVEAGQEWRHQAYVRVGDPRIVLETVAGVGAFAMVPAAIDGGQYLIAAYSAMFATGFLFVAGLSATDFLEVVTLRRLGRRAFSTVRAISPALPLLGAAALLLLLAARMAEPFEDGYGHWLLAANLASTGRLHDPLFSMEDTWLPAYELLAAAMLKVFGLWQLGLLKAMSAVFGLAAAACVYALAPNPRQARIAVVLLVLNPVFLFTSGAAVVEPMLTALLMASALAAVRGRMKLAAALAVLACLTSTKAWLWVAAAVGFAILEAIRSRSAARSAARSVAWAVPALGVLVFLQLGFAPATHSVVRASVEVTSATARGSLPASSLDRVAELATTYGLAALPLLVFAALGAVMAIRRPLSSDLKTIPRQASAMWRFVYVPSAVYLATVFALVAGGAYTGSHRYLYPALPAAALLAAAALDRYTVVIRTATLVAAAMLALAFVPVFSSFAAQNAGLVAAGRAAGTTPGALVTDSPVAAYYSGKTPAQIAGSQALPGGRAQAVAWMSAHNVTSLVVEEISYYNATAVFPDLATGDGSPPFASIGQQASYQVAGGKTVYAYRLLPTLSMEPTAAGKTEPLAKGMTMGPVATGEGMGFAVPIVHYPDGWVYPGTSTTAALSSTSWTRTFQLDEIGGDAARGYRFVPTPSRGEVAVTYAIDASGVAISIAVGHLDPGYSEVGVLNEMSSAFDDFAAAGQPTLVGAAFGNWVPVTGGWARLRSASLDLEWSLPALPGATLDAGREDALPDFDWAGLDYMFPAPFAGASYRINVQEAR